MQGRERCAKEEHMSKVRVEEPPMGRVQLEIGCGQVRADLSMVSQHPRFLGKETEAQSDFPLPTLLIMQVS